MDNLVLKAARRDLAGKSAKTLRREGLLPAVMYGHNFEPVAITLNAHDASLQLAALSSSTIINIDLDGEQHAALVREKQMDYIKHAYLHVDFQIVSLTEKIRTEVAIVLQGTSPAVRDQNAVLVTSLTNIEVEALPRDLPEHITVDISKLINVGDAIYVRDLTIPEAVEVLTPSDDLVVVATGAAKEEVEPEAEVAEVAAEPEVIERGKKEEEEEEA